MVFRSKLYKVKCSVHCFINDPTFFFSTHLHQQSGKLVLKLFTTIKEVAEDPASLVIILIDEVESIAYSRDSVSAQEPSDSLRVVNAVLTQVKI